MTPSDDEPQSSTVLEVVLENRLEILMALTLAHLMGLTTTATEYVGGCF